jgi:hypothetical protein
MNNLENPDILSDEIIVAIVLIQQRCPEAVFGGSIALNAVGLLNRKIKDIDLFFDDKYTYKMKEGFLTIPTTEVLSDTVTDTNGKQIQRTALKVNGINVCGFKVGGEELQHSMLTIYRNNITIAMRIQNVNYAIQAKTAYRFKNEKHQSDLENINKTFNDIF